MADRKARIFRAVLHGLRYTGAGRILRPLTAGRGVVFTLHHVRPETGEPFAPNRLLEVTPEFLDEAVGAIRDAGYDIVTLGEAVRRLSDPEARKFCALTFDDGYRDVRDHALPILRRHGAPSTLFIATAFADHAGDLWWLTLEDALRRLDHVEAEIAGEAVSLPLRTLDEKYAAWQRIYWLLRGLDEAEMRAAIQALAERAGVTATGHSTRLCMDWDELRALREDTLVEFGAHTVNHYMLAKWPDETVRAELARSRARVADELGRAPAHLAYPVGDPTSAGAREFALAGELGFESAWTTRPGHLFAGHAAHITALPRVSLNGFYQDRRFVDVFLDGAPFALWNRFRRINVA